ncbi:MAG TPA: DUF5131 family protein [Phycisphaerae bacterium]|nr:DUF5131 family protein [Phycisphaerae bacterium]
MNRTGIPYLDFAWNPFGFGCSNRCDGCWARRLAPRVGKNTCPPGARLRAAGRQGGRRVGCPDCAAFRPHFHAERLDQPARRRKPAAIGVQFTGELFDPGQPDERIREVLDAAREAGIHDYVFLTQQIERAAACMRWYWGAFGGFWHLGATVRDQPEADEAVPKLLAARGPIRSRWVSIEPIRGPVDLGYTFTRAYRRAGGRAVLDGVIVGSDNRPARRFSLAWVRQIVAACRAAKVPVFVKQLILPRCDECRTVAEPPAAAGEPCPDCRVGRLRLACVTNPAKFPPDLRIRELPWTLTTKGPNA